MYIIIIIILNIQNVLKYLAETPVWGNKRSDGSMFWSRFKTLAVSFVCSFSKGKNKTNKKPKAER